ncbi:hypothetical protein [Guptibacillus hwajinpoensis]|uniref:YqbF C-terminal domain-containing protein n=1 Tax=Guptibacillus hwajinpoensis TaxID=208199 RepID=A0A0J6FW68_9BACL|nr:hypothetical protein [Alkalihalobacillus macyae]KMM38602.1 hypothetical protein AB986_04805 [Alkalihalobacillus macyae]
MIYKVMNGFKDIDDHGTIYKPGEKYPKGDYKPSQKRIAELSKEHPKYKRVFIEEVEEKSNESIERLTATDIKKMNKAPQEELIVNLNGDPSEASNEEERIALILDLQKQLEENEKPSPEK